MKFAIITDSHIGPSPFYRGIDRIMSHHSEQVVTELADTLNRRGDIAFIAQLGDLSQDDLRYKNVEFDRANFNRALWYFKKFTAPVFHCVGNHDRENLDAETLSQLLGYEKLYHSADIGGFHLVFLYTRHFNHERMIIEPEQLAWLEADLAGASQKTFVFMHHPISDQDLTGNFWFDTTPHKALVENRAEVRAILERSGRVSGVFNGHLHWNNKTVHHGIPYFTVQSCIEDAAGTGAPTKTYAIVTVESGAVSVEIHGSDPARYTHPAV